MVNVEDSRRTGERTVMECGASNVRKPVTDSGKTARFYRETFRLILDGCGVVLFELAIERGLADSE
jgi:hypothetical protein